MELAYYPGCSLEGTSWELNDSIKAVCGSLGINLEELHDWNCCGASSAHALDEYLNIALPARNLVIAEKTGKEVLIPCVACYAYVHRRDQCSFLHRLFPLRPQSSHCSLLLVCVRNKQLQ